MSLSELISKSLSLKTIQAHVNEVTVIHTWINTVGFWVVISKHGTGRVGHRGQIKKGILALVWHIVGNWAS